jgi:hypothetical protein
MSSWTSILNSLTENGVTSGVAGKIVQSLAGQNSVRSKTTTLLNQLLAESASPAAVAETITQIEQVPGVPAAVVTALESLRGGGVTQMQIMQAIPAIEAAIAAANPSVF